MPETMESRIDRMYHRDCTWAIIALVALWLTIAFVFFEVVRLGSDSGIVIALAAGAGVLLLFNTAAILALVRHYTTDKAHLYGLDLFYVDAMRAAAKGQRNDA